MSKLERLKQYFEEIEAETCLDVSNIEDATKLEKIKNNTSMWYEKKDIRKKIYEKCINENSVIAEVGVRLGENACMMFFRNPKKLYLIDPWLAKPGYPHHRENDYFYKRVENAFGGIENISILRETSLEASKKFNEEYFDAVYVDAAHTYKEVLEDLELWAPKIKIGGYIIGDDYFGEKNPDDRVKWKRHEYGVIEALEEFLKKHKNFKIHKSESLKKFPLPGGQFVLERSST